MMNFRTLFAATEAMARSSNDCYRPLRGVHAGYIPNIIVQTHRNQKAWFYDDLLWRKTVLIHCMAVEDRESCANVENLARVQPLIGDELGRSVFIYSITTAPTHDTPARLRMVAEKHGAKDGWSFLTGDGPSLELLRQRLFSHGGGQDCSMSLLRYGNETAGLWGGIMASAKPEAIAQRLAWITSRKEVAGPYRRGGPPVLPEHE